MQLKSNETLHAAASGGNVGTNRWPTDGMHLFLQRALPRKQRRLCSQAESWACREWHQKRRCAHTAAQGSDKAAAAAVAVLPTAAGPGARRWRCGGPEGPPATGRRGSSPGRTPLRKPCAVQQAGREQGQVPSLTCHAPPCACTASAQSDEAWSL